MECLLLDEIVQSSMKEPDYLEICRPLDKFCTRCAVLQGANEDEIKLGLCDPMALGSI